MISGPWAGGFFILPKHRAEGVSFQSVETRSRLAARAGRAQAALRAGYARPIVAEASVHSIDRSPAPLLALILTYLRHRLALLATSLRPRHRARDIAALTALDSAPPGG
jgi:hypothetical protein